MTTDIEEFDRDFVKACEIDDLLHEIAKEPGKKSAIDCKAMDKLMRWGHCFQKSNQREFLYLVSLVVKYWGVLPWEHTVTHCPKKNVDTESDLS